MQITHHLNNGHAIPCWCRSVRCDILCIVAFPPTGILSWRRGRSWKANITALHQNSAEMPTNHPPAEWGGRVPTSSCHHRNPSCRAEAQGSTVISKHKQWDAGVSNTERIHESPWAAISHVNSNLSYYIVHSCASIATIFHLSVSLSTGAYISLSPVSNKPVPQWVYKRRRTIIPCALALGKLPSAYPQAQSTKQCRFNSYTQQLCIDNAVIKENKNSASDKDLKPKLHDAKTGDTVSQQVTFTSRFIENSSDITEAMNVSGRSSIRDCAVAILLILQKVLWRSSGMASESMALAVCGLH